MGTSTDPVLFERIVETARLMFTVVDADFRVTYTNPVTFDLLGYAPEELIGTNAMDYLHPEDVEVATGALLQIVGESRGRLGVGIPLGARVRAKDGSYHSFEIGALVQLGDRDVQGVILRLRPIDGQALLDVALHAMAAGDALDEVLALLARSVSAEVGPAEASVSYDWDGSRFAHAVSTGLEPVLTGTGVGVDGAPWELAIRKDETLAIGLADLPDPIATAARERGMQMCWAVPVAVLDEEESACLIVWRRESDGPWVSHHIALGRVAQLIALAFRRRRDEALLVQAALHDGLTGVANRTQFFRELDGALANPGGPSLGVLYLDLDDFKPVNDEHGHAAGDELLKVISERIGASVRPGDLVARLGGDEFAVLCRGVDGVDELVVIAERLVAHIAEPVCVADTTARVAVSVGISFCARSGPHVPVLERADAALREAKANGKGRWHLDR
ncbi:MAG: diguanylate cyclase [Actinobacteria bacterium]|nr:diguanylate cyclase [Actinomycetota bacterium]